MVVEGLLIVAVGVGSYLLSRANTPRRALVLYTAEGDGAAEFISNANTAARALRTQAVPIMDGQSLLTAVRSAPGNLEKVLMIGHGTSSAFFRPGNAGLRIGQDALPTWLGDDHFAQELARKLAANFVISLAGCRAGASSDEPDWTSEAYWTSSTPGTGGARSLAGQIRDALVAARAKNGEVRAHSTTGGVVANPSGRSFRVDSAYVGRPGVALLDIVLGAGASRDRATVARWNSTIRGASASRWMLGGSAPTRQEASV